MSLKFSVIVPIYNGEKYLLECIQSIRNQIYDNYQLIVVNNESTDNSENILKENNIQYINAKNIWKYTWDDAVEEAFKCFDEDVDYFTIIACDDIIEENYLNNLNRILSLANLDSIQTPIETFGMSNKEVIRYKDKNFELYKSELLERCCVTTPSVVYKTYLKNHWYAKPEEFAGASDYYRYCKFADELHLKIVNFPAHIGYKYRIHSDQATWGMHRDYKGIDQKIQEEFRNKWLKNETLVKTR